jgi:hypothetical protein
MLGDVADPLPSNDVIKVNMINDKNVVLEQLLIKYLQTNKKDLVDEESEDASDEVYKL